MAGDDHRPGRRAQRLLQVGGQGERQVVGGLIEQEQVGRPDDDGSVLPDTGLLRRSDLDTAVSRLSVGQRRRLALGVLVARPPDLLLLDEPTNHLSLTLAADLEEALGTAPGTVIVASHDRWLRRRWTGSEYRLAG